MHGPLTSLHFDSWKRFLFVNIADYCIRTEHCKLTGTEIRSSSADQEELLAATGEGSQGGGLGAAEGTPERAIFADTLAAVQSSDPTPSGSASAATTRFHDLVVADGPGNPMLSQTLRLVLLLLTGFCTPCNAGYCDAVNN